jgi:hopanoid biosynthesis associated protein HpnK
MQIVVNADDFGCSTSINTAVIQAHLRGVLTSASLMVTGDAVEEAVALAKKTPSLAVGLHVVVAGGQAALSLTQIPHLVDGNGRFPDNPLRAGVQYFFNRAAREELAQELEAQFERFAATGLSLSHVDSHLHMHVHPTVFGLLLPLLRKYGATGLRLPRDDFWLAMDYDRCQAGKKAAWALAFGLLSHQCLAHLDGDSPVVTDRVYGLMQTGQMREAYVLALLGRLQVPTAELYFHPSTVAEGNSLGPNAGDLAALLSPAVRQTIEERGIRLATYSSLSEESS